MNTKSPVWVLNPAANETNRQEPWIPAVVEDKVKLSFTSRRQRFNFNQILLIILDKWRSALYDKSKSSNQRKDL